MQHPAQRLHEGQVHRQPRDVTELVGAEPPVCVVVHQLGLPRHQPAQVDAQHGRLTDRKVAPETAPDLDLDPELFTELAPERLLVGLTGLDLAPWELPEARQAGRFGAPRREHRALADQRRPDDPHQPHGRQTRAVHPLLAAQAAQAEALLSEDVLRYYAGGAGEQVSLHEAAGAWSAVRLRPRVLRDVSRIDTSVELFGSRLATPVLVGPTAAHGLAAPEGELATARGTAAAGSLLVLSTRASREIEDVPAGPWWFQAYVMRDREQTLALARRAVSAGAGAIVLTGDVPYLGKRHGKTRLDLLGPPAPGTQQDPSAGLEAIDQLIEATGLPVLVKGVLRGDDAVACLEAGAAGVIVSNHGGRQLDRALPSAHALPEVVAAVGGAAPVLVDGGLRCGLDVLCALALGADAVLLGRPALWALAAGGADGVESCLRAMTDDLAHAMGLAGARSLAEITHDLVHLP